MAYDFHPDAKQELDDAVAYDDNISRETRGKLVQT
jgi:hypothetical protein